MNSRSLDSLNPSARCGFRSNAFQIRPIVDLLSPVRSAIFARVQCVAFPGVDSKVATTTSPNDVWGRAYGRGDGESSTEAAMDTNAMPVARRRRDTVLTVRASGQANGSSTGAILGARGSGRIRRHVDRIGQQGLANFTEHAATIGGGGIT
jgi:hypothetical protein